MIQTGATHDTLSLLDAISHAYAQGNTPLAERLFTQALDDELPWNEICAAAARGVSERYGDHERV